MNAGVERRQRAAYLRHMVPAIAGYAAGWIV
jgi:hypothetical protein